MSGDSQQGGATARTPTPIDVPLRAVERGDTMVMNDLLDRLAPYVAWICGPIALEHAPNAGGAPGARPLQGALLWRPGGGLLPYAGNQGRRIVPTEKYRTPAIPPLVDRSGRSLRRCAERGRAVRLARHGARVAGGRGQV
jgi:hypothetical protein